ncbi:MAG: RNA methyltransferase [Bacteroidaceae bacterium]|nr:RNA methyltransferase [Bacteroidaceae bacterium]
MQKTRITEMGRLDVEAFRRAEKMPLTVVLDNVRSFHNVGAVFRTADAYRVERIVLCGMTAQPPAPEIHKTALGAEDAVAWTYEAETLEAVRRLKAEGYTVFAIEQAHGSTPLQQLDCLLERSPEKKFAIILGHEVKGVQQEVVDAADNCIELPQFGTKHSLNVSVTAGIVIWEFAQRLLALSATR